MTRLRRRYTCTGTWRRDIEVGNCVEFRITGTKYNRQYPVWMVAEVVETMVDMALIVGGAAGGGGLDGLIIGNDAYQRRRRVRVRISKSQAVRIIEEAFTIDYGVDSKSGNYARYLRTDLVKDGGGGDLDEDCIGMWMSSESADLCRLGTHFPFVL